METTLDLMCLTMTLKMWILFLQWSWQCASIWHIVFLFVFVGLCLSSPGTIYYLSSIVVLAKLFHLDIYILTCYNKVSFVHCDSVFNVQCNTCTEQKHAVLLYELPRKHAHTYFWFFSGHFDEAYQVLWTPFFSPSIIILGSGFMSLYFYPCLKVVVGLLLGGHVWLRRCSKTKNLSGWYLTALHCTGLFSTFVRWKDDIYKMEIYHDKDPIKTFLDALASLRPIMDIEWLSD